MKLGGPIFPSFAQMGLENTTLTLQVLYFGIEGSLWFE